ncbi:nitrile hydratase subunit beta [Streptomyces fulvoviolaceus]|nr:SH3-like domain-containing protein [Streptomyces fulvoviolaceus]MCT9077232.1 nitrile hydratase subunit beta [Streptomyces fulvoviolaceus]
MTEPTATAADRFAPGTRVRTFPHDPPHHTRLPRYARGEWVSWWRRRVDMSRSGARDL